MGLSVTCDCGKTYKVADSAAGKKVRCKACGGLVPVPQAGAMGEDEPDFLSVDPAEPDQDGESEMSALPAKRRATGTKAKGRSADLNAVQRFLVFAVQNPWVAMSLFFLCVWVPLSWPFSEPMLWADAAVMGLCFIGFVIGLICALIGVTYRNPFHVLTALTLGTAVALVVPPGAAPVLARAAGETFEAIAGDKLKGRPARNFDTGLGGSMAVYCAIMGTVALAHVVFVLFVVKPR